MPTKRELREAAAGIERILDAIARGELEASPAYVARLEGAATALRAIGEPAASPARSEGAPSAAATRDG